MYSNNRSRLRKTRQRVEERRKKKIDGVDSIFQSLLTINKTLGDVPGMLNATKETQEALESAETELRYLGEETLPMVNTIGKVLTGTFAIGSIFVLREIFKESKNV